MAAGNILAGFVKGFSGQALDQMEERRRLDAELKKAEMLERLRRETATEVALLQDKLDSAKADDKLSTTDYTTGQRTLRNEKGEQIGVLEIPQSERELYDLELRDKQLGLEGSALDLDVKRANINQSNAAAATSRAYAQRARRLDSSDKDDDKDENKMLVAEYERAFEELESAGAPRSVLANFQTEFHEGVTVKGWTKEQQRTFLNKMRSMFTKDFEDIEGRKRKPLLETYRGANGILDKKLGG